MVFVIYRSNSGSLNQKEEAFINSTLCLLYMSAVVINYSSIECVACVILIPPRGSESSSN